MWALIQLLVSLEEEESTQTHRGEGDVKLKAELGVMQLKPRNAKDCWETRESRKEGRKLLP